MVLWIDWVFMEYIKIMIENINRYVWEGIIVIVNNYLYNNLLERNEKSVVCIFFVCIVCISIFNLE